MKVILDGVRSLHNVGSVFRTADAVGVDKLYLCGVTSAPFDRFGNVRGKLQKTALGAEKTVAWEKVASTAKLISKLKKDGYKIVSIEQHRKSIPYYKFKITNKQLNKLVLVLGNEVKGLSSAILKKSDTVLEIPMGGSKESLNVAVAFGIVAFHIKYE